MLKEKFNLSFDVSGHSNIFLLGVGGGYDIITALLIYYNLKKQGKNIILGSTNHVQLKSFYDGIGEEVCDGVMKMYKDDPKKIKRQSYESKNGEINSQIC